MTPLWETIARMLLSATLGGLIGWERQQQHKPAGFRTVMIVSLASTVYVLAATQAAERYGEAIDAVRAMSGIAQGIGFLGAGAILQSKGEVRWLTTAAALWAAAAIGYAVGIGSYEIAVSAAILVYVALHWLLRLTSRGQRKNGSRLPREDLPPDKSSEL
jgi:putative Mg2+ transporter-C (MgtC) family protein